MSNVRQKVGTAVRKFRSTCSDISHKKFMQYSLVQIFLLALVMNVIIESFSRFSFWKALVYTFTSPLIFLTNTLIIAMIIAPAILFRRRSFFYFFACMLWFAVGVVDFILLHNRVTPFNANDFKMIADGIDVAIHYYSIFQLILLVLAIVVAIGLVVYAFFRFPKRATAIRYAVQIPFCGGILLGCFLLIQLSIFTGVMSKTFANLADAYHEYGLPYCFISSIVDVGIDEPDEYTPEHIDNVLKPLTSTTPTVTIPSDNPTESPNIIFIQLESFFDPMRIKGLEFATDPIPTFRSLMNNYTSGLLTVPSISAGTANTEFEILTGMNMADFGTGEYPYKTILQDTTTESIAYNLRRLGYHAHAIHNNTATFYTRHIVYGNLGFQCFTPIELMTGIELNELAWAKDAVLYDEILSCLNSTAGSDFVFTVSVQGHGSYPDEDVLSDAIDLTDIHDAYDDNTIYGLKYYITQLHEMDELIARLTEYFTKSEEPTVLVLYGDHLPGFGFEESDLTEGSLLQTEYIMWSNFDMEVEHRDLYSYQLAAYVMGRLNYNEGLITKFHQAQLEDSTSNYLEQLNLLSYDMLYGNMYCWNGVNPYAPTELTYGHRDLVLSEVHTIYDESEETYYLQVFGEYFTSYAEIFINGERQKDTIYVSEEELFLPDVKLEDGDIITVAVPINDTIFLRGTTGYRFSAPEEAMVE